MATYKLQLNLDVNNHDISDKDIGLFYFATFIANLIKEAVLYDFIPFGASFFQPMSF